MNQPMEKGSDAAVPRDQLPLPDYDHLPLGSLTQRIRTLEADDLDRLLRYEREHGNRLPVLQLMETRLADLRAGAKPSGGSPSGATPEKSPGISAPRQVDPTTEAPIHNPPFHGVPTNAAQDRSRQD
jgi:hypothetical protein